ncbi:wax ester/triacylglycerol synthase domain-containing protein [Actinomadura roseirufa]|uniref:wax ester/triacylglycerol synthase domain-containing protein n=1 Tax=Actinomadura roseirufa TaxID=2094049 RepID=UPI0010415F7C|nr:wax ester/triacylglycerol synthase domain-containing protein [Actinomadura roseirufa]
MPFLRAGQDPETVPLGPVVRFARRTGMWSDSPIYPCEILEIEGPAPPLATLQAHVAERLDRVPALSYELDDQRKCWAPVPGFDVRPHIGEQRLAPGADALAAALDLPRLPTDRPLWDLTMLHGHDPGTYALCYRAHMMFQDGPSVISTLEALFGRRRLAHPATVSPRPAAEPVRPVLTARAWADLWGCLRRATPWSRGLPSPTGRCAVHSTTLDVPQLLAVAKAHRATLHQVGLASFTGAFRAWAPLGWHKPTAGGGLTLGMTMSLWSPGRSTGLGSQVGVLPVTLACGRSSPLEHLREAMDQTSEERIRIHRARARILLRCAPMALAVLLERFTHQRSAAACVTTFRIAPGLSFGGARVRAVVVVPPRFSTFQRLMISTTQYERTVTAVLVADTSLTASPRTGLPRLETLWHEALTTLHALHT